MSGTILIIMNILVSYKGFKDHRFFDKYSLQVDEILGRKDYKRLITSGFLHTGWIHLLFNMIALQSFSASLESMLGAVKCLLIYSASLIGGSLFSLFIHKNHTDYTAVGASGAISGIIFASIALDPDIAVGSFLLPVHIPGWLFGFLYTIISIYGTRSQSDNIGHEAHFAGGITGLLAAIIIVPVSVINNYLPILLILIPSAVFIYLLMTRPGFLIFNQWHRKRDYFDIDDKYITEKIKKEQELDALLDKINKKGIDSLSKKEKEKLEQHSDVY